MMPVVQRAERDSANETVKQGFRVQQPCNKTASWKAATTETYVYNQEKEVFA